MHGCARGASITGSGNRVQVSLKESDSARKADNLSAVKTAIGCVLIGVATLLGGYLFIRVEADNELAKRAGVLPGSTLLVQTRLDPSGWEYFQDLDTWTFYLNGSFSNSMRLTFEDDTLVKIYRHRKEFELP